MAKKSNKSSGRGRRGNRRRYDRNEAPKENDKAVVLEGTVSSVLAGTMFKVKLDTNAEHEVLAHISGKMRKRFIRLVIGDRVRMEMSPYDTTKARITFRIDPRRPDFRRSR